MLSDGEGEVIPSEGDVGGLGGCELVLIVVVLDVSVVGPVSVGSIMGGVVN